MRPTEPCGSPQDLHLRPAVADDLPVVAVVQRRARLAAPMPDVTVAEVAATLAEGWEDDEHWVAEVGGEVVGHLRLVLPDAERVGWVDDLYVLPEHAGQGVGSALLELARARLPEGFGLWAFVSNVPARAFYAGRGLREVEEVPADASPHGQAEVRLAWRPGEWS